MYNEKIKNHFMKVLEKPYGPILNLLIRDFNIDLEKFESKYRNTASIINIVKDISEKDFSKVIEFYEKNKKVLALHPTEVEHILKINRYERSKLQEDGHLTVLYYSNLYKYRKPVKVPYFDALDILRISDDDLNMWRNPINKIKKQKEL